MIKKSTTDTMRYGMVFLALAVLFCAAIVWNINTGSVDISLTDIIRIILSKDSTDPASYNIIWKIRLPRLLTAAVLGGALSLSGFLLQTFFRNPIAGPFVLGISSGAKMVVGITLIFLTQYIGSISSLTLILAAFLGSLLITFIVLLFSQKVRNMSMLLVIGIMVGYICGAVTDFCITFF
jgi:iron complex transport system permease protein